MKSFLQFAEDLKQTKGFGDKSKARKKKKRKYLSDREAKLLDLKQRPFSWQGLK